MPQVPNLIVSDKNAVPLHLVKAASLPNWQKSRPAAVQTWLKSNGFEGKIDQYIIIPDARGKPEMAVCGIAPQPEFWNFCVLPSMLPYGTYRLEGGIDAELATMVRLGGQ